jgi:hypothetical protein
VSVPAGFVPGPAVLRVDLISATHEAAAREIPVVLKAKE